jgi:hypothetical protein
VQPVDFEELGVSTGWVFFIGPSGMEGKELDEFLRNPASHDQLEYVATTGPVKYANCAVHQFGMVVAQLSPGNSWVKRPLFRAWVSDPHRIYGWQKGIDAAVKALQCPASGVPKPTQISRLLTPEKNPIIRGLVGLPHCR